MTRRRPRLRPVPTFLVALCLSMLGVAGVAAAEIEEPRDLYKEQAEPICKTNKEASDRYLMGVHALIRQGKPRVAGERFAKAATALEKAQKQLAAVEQPPADAPKLTKWLAGIKAQ